MVRHVFSIGLVTDCRGWDQRNSNYRHRQHLRKQVPLNFLFCNLYENEQEINFNFHNFVLLRFVFSFDGTMQTRFDGKGKRLLCKQFSKAPIVYDVPSEQQQTSEGDPFIDEQTGETIIEKRQQQRQQSMREYNTSLLDVGVDSDEE